MKNLDFYYKVILSFDKIFILYSAPLCKCDFRGKQANFQDGDWCWLQESPCKTLNGITHDSSNTWERCEHQGVKQLECDTFLGDNKT